jgi:AcrR family transcriptional regulator
MGEPQLADDLVRARLLEAAVRVFARQGYGGTKVLDVVREAGLSTGAVYGRFRSKEELLREAVVSRSRQAGHVVPGEAGRVADVIRRAASVTGGPLSDEDAVRLEAYATARRQPEVAAALAEARRSGREAVQPLVEAAVADGTVAPGVDPEAVLFFVQTMRLGILLQRGAGVGGPDPAAWDDLIARIVASFGDHEAVPAASPAPPNRKGTDR